MLKAISNEEQNPSPDFALSEEDADKNNEDPTPPQVADFPPVSEGTPTRAQQGRLNTASRLHSSRKSVQSWALHPRGLISLIP